MIRWSGLRQEDGRDGDGVEGEAVGGGRRRFYLKPGVSQLIVYTRSRGHTQVFLIYFNP